MHAMRVVRSYGRLGVITNNWYFGPHILRQQANAGNGLVSLRRFNWQGVPMVIAVLANGDTLTASICDERRAS